MKKAGLMACAVVFAVGAGVLASAPSTAAEGCFGEVDPLLPGTWQIEDQPRFEAATGDQQPDQSGKPQDDMLTSDCAVV